MTDRFNVRVVVVALAIGVLGGLAAMSFLAFTQTPIPDQLDRLITFLSGGLSAVLVSTKVNPGEDEPVAVVGVEGGPVETVEVAAAETPSRRRGQTG